MSHYTTGEIAKLCGVSVRTVQYYDRRNLLLPSALSEGGRRLYTQQDVKRLKTICVLRELGLSINVIGRLLEEEDPGSVIDLLLDQQLQALQAEITQRRTQIDRLTELRKELKTVRHFSLESIGDMADIMENRKKLRNLYIVILAIAIPLELFEIGTILLWVLRGIWWPFVLWVLLAIPAIAILMRFYYKRVAYICPQCQSSFRPGFAQFFLASHTPRTRKLTCSCCGHKGFCVETWGGK